MAGRAGAALAATNRPARRDTKVNRCLTGGGRRSSSACRASSRGAECELLAPLLSALADGEATATDMAALRPHLRGCLACRARLREYRAAPGRVAGLVPPAALAAGSTPPEAPARWLESLLAWAGEHPGVRGAVVHTFDHTGASANRGFRLSVSC